VSFSKSNTSLNVVLYILPLDIYCKEKYMKLDIKLLRLL